MKIKLGIIFTVIICFFLFHLNSTQAQETGNVTGWAWNSSTGWLSMSCQNQNSCDRSNYGFYINMVSGEVSGYIWSQYLGWICFGATCSGQPPEGTAETLMDKGTGRFSGWARIINLQNYNDTGWVRLAGTTIDGSEYYVKVDFTTMNLMGWGWHGDPSGVGWINFDSSLAWSQLPPEITPPETPPAITRVPWIETQYGDIYSGGDIGSLYGTGYASGRFNATYIIQAGGRITNFRSAGTLWQPGTALKDWLIEDFDKIDFPSPENNYTNVLGRLDIDGIINNGQMGLGRYGFVRVFSGQDLSSPVALSPDPLLNGEIYYFRGGSSIDNEITFRNGLGEQSGAGVIVVDGDLAINKNVTYSAEKVTGSIKNLAVVIWIVRGDLKIAPEVTKLVGAFVVLKNESGVGGQVTTGSSETKLEVEGLMIAHKFDFERYYTAGGEPSEQIIYDGRLLANTHPAIKDFSAVLPIWRSSG